MSVALHRNTSRDSWCKTCSEGSVLLCFLHIQIRANQSISNLKNLATLQGPGPWASQQHEGVSHHTEGDGMLQSAQHQACECQQLAATGVSATFADLYMIERAHDACAQHHKGCREEESDSHAVVLL